MKRMLFVMPLVVFVILGYYFYDKSNKQTEQPQAKAPKNMVQHGVDFSDQKAVEVIDYNGDYFLVSKLRVGEPHAKHADGAGCPEKHWHADSEITAVNNGRVMADPLSGGCGFGTLNERPVMNYFPHDLLVD